MGFFFFFLRASVISCGFLAPFADMICSWQMLVAPEAQAQVHCLGRELAGGNAAGPRVSLGSDRSPTASAICSCEGCLTASAALALEGERL